MTELSTTGGITIDSFRKLQQQIPDLPTEDLTDVFARLNDVHKVTKEVEDDLKKELRSRQSEGGKDAKGNSYLSGKTGGVKLELRTYFELAEDAEERLAEANLIEMFPTEPDIELMKRILSALNVDPCNYSNYVVSVAAIADLVEKGELDPTFAESLLNRKTTYAVKNIDMKELPDARV